MHYRAIRRPVSLCALVVLLLSGGALSPAEAQRVPDNTVIEITIKRALASFNDANVTGNYDVFHATLSRPFRQQFTAERLREAFKTFQSQSIDISPVLALSPVLSAPARIDGDGALLLKGAFETRPSRVLFDMRLLPVDGDWKLVAIHVNVEPVSTEPGPGQQGSGKSGRAR